LQERTPAELAVELDRHCPHCHRLLVPDVVEYPAPWLESGVIRREVFAECDCPGAERERERRIETQVEFEAKQKAEALRQALVRAGIVGDLARCTFDQFKRRENWGAASALAGKVRKYVDAVLGDNLQGKPWLIMYGRYGTGKTHLAAAAIIETVTAGMRDCYFRGWTQYLSRLKASWNDGATERTSDIEAELQRGRLIVLDDIDKARDPSGWARETLYTVLERRYQLQLPTILTFNYSMTETDTDAPGQYLLERFMTRAVIDRILGAKWDVLNFDGPSYRSGLAWDVTAPQTARR
jgi:DNA replication protein DnaC